MPYESVCTSMRSQTFSNFLGLSQNFSDFPSHAHGCPFPRTTKRLNECAPLNLVDGEAADAAMYTHFYRPESRREKRTKRGAFTCPYRCSWKNPTGAQGSSVSTKARHCELQPTRYPFVTHWLAAAKSTGSASSSSASSLSASSAAMQPVPAEVIAWRYFLSCTSPAAKTPLTEVCVVPGTVTM